MNQNEGNEAITEMVRIRTANYNFQWNNTFFRNKVAIKVDASYINVRELNFS